MESASNFPVLRIAGMTAALNLAQQGFEVHPVERTAILGGSSLNLKHTWAGEHVSTQMDNLIYKVIVDNTLCDGCALCIDVCPYHAITLSEQGGAEGGATQKTVSMVHPEFVIEALNMGADAVMILGCRLNECHYLDGNHKALARSELIIELMEDLGYEKERFSLHWLSSSEPNKFVAAVTEMDERIKKLSAMQDSTSR